MPEMSQKTWLLVVASLVLVVGYLGFQLSARNTTIGLLNDDNAGLNLEKLLESGRVEEVFYVHDDDEVEEEEVGGGGGGEE